MIFSFNVFNKKFFIDDKTGDFDNDFLKLPVWNLNQAYLQVTRNKGASCVNNIEEVKEDLKVHGNYCFFNGFNIYFFQAHKKEEFLWKKKK